MSYVIDSSAWIEYLSGSISGEKVNNILKKDTEIYVISNIISEVVSFVKRNDGNIETAYSAIIKNSKIIDITPKIAKEAGLLHAEKRKKGINLSLADSLIICTVKSIKAKLVTKDSHFKEFKETELI